MKPHLKLALVLALATGFYAWGRPRDIYELMTRVNGDLVRPLGEDGGVTGLRGLLLQGTGISSVPIVTGAIYYVECMPDGGAAHVCTYSTDGGCSADPTDINYGRLVQPAQVGLYFVVGDVADRPASTPASRVYANADQATAYTCPVWRMK